MHPNPVLKKLGFANDDRVVIFHTDDVGMCQASLTAFSDLDGFGLISSGAMMVPSPWFLAVADYCRQHPQVDLGVHLTLTSEWETYRWGPISTRDPASGLIDAEGYFLKKHTLVWDQADPEFVQAELQAQVNCALTAGVDITHLDGHMGAVAHMKFLPAYVQLALFHRLPFLAARMDQAAYEARGMESSTAAIAVQMIAQLEEMGVPLLDFATGLPLNRLENRLEQAKQVLAKVPAGITHFIIHPAQDTPELRAIASDWQCRVADYQTFMSEEMRTWIKNTGIQVIGYRPLRDLLRG